ncbi:small multi-drug export protein [Flavonifractor plautii]
MVPVIELRGGVPFGTALGLAPLHALVVCIIGNMLPIPFIIVYIRRIFHWMRRRSPGSTLWWTSWRRRPT